MFKALNAGITAWGISSRSRYLTPAPSSISTVKRGVQIFTFEFWLPPAMCTPGGMKIIYNLRTNTLSCI